VQDLLAGPSNGLVVRDATDDSGAEATQILCDA